MTAYTPEKENNYLLWIIHIIKTDSFIYQSHEHTTVQITVNIPFNTITWLQPQAFGCSIIIDLARD
jgi:hypothetical protein